MLALAGSPPSLAQIVKLEAELKKLPQLAIETNHYHAAGLYAREIHIPAGTVLTGKTHKTEHLNILSRGEIAVWTEQGIKRLKAPFVLVSAPSTKRVGFAITDTTWVTVHATESRDLAEIEKQIISDEPLAIEEDIKCLG